ncbi:MAG: methyltransferase regulatory domain-containing protein [Chloracidobacterium sp.]|nr:methyltransferase regulatory domain-containing protein [Chloracidobacterium sp.]
MATTIQDNQMPYRSGVFPLNRPDRIGAVAAIHGVAVSDVERCRVLELGCGDGVTLLSIAHSMPTSECIGVDLLSVRIAEAKKYAAEIGLTNVSFRARDVMDLDPKELGQFDYVIAHGLYSWVPDAVSERLLLIYRECLKPDGAGLISYNTFPGWHLRDLLRDAMRFADGATMKPAARAENAFEFVRQLVRSIASDKPHQSILANELESASRKELSVLLYDELSENNRPCLFQTFVERLERSGLKYVAEIEPRLPHGLIPEAQAMLDDAEGDPIRREQLLDFLLCTRFRNSIVCRAENRISPDPLPDALENLYLTTNTAPPPHASLSDDSEVPFSRPDNSTFTTNHAMTKSMLGLLSRRRPARVAFAEIRSHLASEFPDLGNAKFENELVRTKQFAIKLMRSAILDVGCFRPPIAATISSRPTASEFARWQAAAGWEYVTNMYGASFEIENDLLRALIVVLDGSKGADEIPASILELVQVSEQDQKMLTEMLPGLVDLGLEQLRQMALLVD